MNHPVDSQKYLGHFPEFKTRRNAMLIAAHCAVNKQRFLRIAAGRSSEQGERAPAVE